MSDIRWMIYGANGYTGRLVTEVAIRRGHRPVLAGRSPDAIIPLAEELGLEYAVFQLDDVNTIAEATADLDLFYHAAGPFIYTSDPVLRACLATGTHYLDITGEIPVLQNTLTYDDTARKNGVALVSGAGFDVIPTDCLARYVASQLPSVDTLELGVHTASGASAGTVRTGLEMARAGTKVRRHGQLQSIPTGSGATTIRLTNGLHHAMPIPWGDLVTAHRSTGASNISVYMAVPENTIRLAAYLAPPTAFVLRSRLVRAGLGQLVDWLVHGPDAQSRATLRSAIWARATSPEGQVAEAWLDTCEAYRFTAEAAVLAVEQLMATQPAGALTPSLAFGADFVLGVCDTQRLDALPVP